MAYPGYYRQVRVESVDFGFQIVADQGVLVKTAGHRIDDDVVLFALGKDVFSVFPDSGKSFVNVKIGFAGYNATRTDKYPQGQPNALIARAVNSGTTFRKKTRFVDKAVSASKKSAEAAMDAACNREIEKIMK